MANESVGHFCMAWGSCAYCAFCGKEMPVATYPQAPASPQPEAEAQKAVAWEPEMRELIAKLRNGDWSLRSPDELACMVADMLERALPRISTPSAGAPLPEQRQEAAQVEPSGLSAGAAYALKNPQGVWSSYEVEKREHARCEAELRNCEARIREQRAEIKRLVAAPTPQAVKVPLTPEQIKRELDAAKVPDSEDDAYDFQVWRACERFYGIHPTEGERG